MKKTTIRRTWGRSQLVQQLRGAIADVERARDAKARADRNSALTNALKSLKLAAEAMDIYGIDRKRIRFSLELERKHLEALLERAKGIPLTMDEKTMARQKKSQASFAARGDGSLEIKIPNRKK